jgi:hypothetical protein
MPDRYLPDPPTRPPKSTTSRPSTGDRRAHPGATRPRAADWLDQAIVRQLPLNDPCRWNLASPGQHAVLVTDCREPERIEPNHHGDRLV